MLVVIGDVLAIVISILSVHKLLSVTGNRIILNQPVAVAPVPPDGDQGKCGAVPLFRK